MALPLKWMPAYSHGGPFTAGQPTVVVVHSTESDNTPAMAEALAGPNWFGGSKAGTSAHKIVDVDSICEGVKRTTVAYHAGPGGNVRGIAYEFCGRAGWTAAQWRAPAQLQMLRNAAPHIADDLRAMSAPARWLSLAQLGAKQRGMCTHNDIRLAFGGTTHSDPGPSFPYAELLSYVQAELAGTPLEDDMQASDRITDPLFNGSIRVSEGLFAAFMSARKIDDLANTVTALTEAVRAMATQRSDIDQDALLAGIEKIVQANRARLNVTVSPVDAA